MFDSFPEQILSLQPIETGAHQSGRIAGGWSGQQDTQIMLRGAFIPAERSLGATLAGVWCGPEDVGGGEGASDPSSAAGCGEWAARLGLLSPTLGEWGPGCLLSPSFISPTWALPRGWRPQTLVSVTRSW